MSLSLWMGRHIGNLVYYLNKRQRRTGYLNLKAALGYKIPPKELKKILRKSYQNLGRMLAEITKFPSLNKKYLDKFIKIEGLEYAEKVKEKGTGLIFLTAHFGNWELSAQIAGLKGFPMKVLAKAQRYERLNNLLNAYRNNNNCRVVAKGWGIKSILRSLKHNETLGILGDQDSRRDDLFVDFLGRSVLAAKGVFSLASKTGSTIIPSFITRKDGPKHTLYMNRPLEFKKEMLRETDIKKYLQEFHNMLARHIKDKPEEYLWIQKRWRFSPEKSILVLTDGKAGHLNQAKAICKLLKAELKKSGLTPKLPYSQNEGYKIIEVKFKNNISSSFLTGASFFASSGCQGCLKCLKKTMEEESYKEIIRSYADYIISCGSRLAAVNLILSKENNAKSITIMKPSFKLKSFDLAIIPRHDLVKETSNVVITEGAPNLIDKELIEEESRILSKNLKLEKKSKIGFFFGGNTTSYRYQDFQLKGILSQMKEAADDLNLEILMTTSRRTGSHFESLIEESLKNFKRCKLLILAGRGNPPHAVGGILGLSDIAVVSFDSISMISEAVSSGKYVVVFTPDDYSKLKAPKKHKRLIDSFVYRGFIHLTKTSDLNKALKNIFNNKPEIKELKDNENIQMALKKII